VPVTAPESPTRARRIAVTSGKGGVGKTSLAINLAVAAARLGHRVAILDADFSLGNVDVLLGLAASRHLGAVVAGSSRLEEITIDGPSGVRVIPAGSGVPTLSRPDAAMWARLRRLVDDASAEMDYLFIDTGPGISDTVLDVIGLTDHVVVVTCPDLAAMVDAYALIKLVTAADADKPIGIVVNVVTDADEGAAVYRHIATATERFLGRTLRYEGSVPADPLLRAAGLCQTPLIGAPIRSAAERCIRRIASRLLRADQNSGPWPAPHQRHAAPPMHQEAGR